MTADRVFDGHGLTSADTVVIERALITEVGRLERIGVDGTAMPIVRYPGHTLIPGLIDSHVHLTLNGRADGPAASAQDREAVRSLSHEARAGLLRAGVTSARDLGGRRDVLAAPGSLPEDGPDMRHAFAPVTKPGGHLHYWGGAVASPADAERVIAENVRSGATWTKIVINGGFLTPSSHPADFGWAPGELAGIVRTAQAHGTRVAAHVHTSEGVWAALQAGADTLEHASLLTRDLEFSFDLDLARRIADSSAWVCPTVGSNAITSVNWPRRADVLGHLIDAGVRVIAGTDAGIPDTPHDRYGDGLIALSQVLGATGALRAATIAAAAALGLGDRGVLRPGHLADITVIAGNPLQDISAIRAVAAVYQRGKQVVTSGLS